MISRYIAIPNTVHNGYSYALKTYAYNSIAIATRMYVSVTVIVATYCDYCS